MVVQKSPHISRVAWTSSSRCERTSGGMFTQVFVITNEVVREANLYIRDSRANDFLKNNGMKISVQ